MATSPTRIRTQRQLLALALLVSISTAHLGYSQAAEGTGILSGRLYDEATGMGLVGVAVALPPSDRTTTSDQQGKYQFSKLPEGAYTLEASKDGFQGVRSTELKITSKEDVSFDSALKAVPPAKTGGTDEVVQLEAFTVVAETGDAADAAGFTALRQNAAVSVDILSAKDMGKFTGSNVADLLIRVPGVSMARGGFAVIRGLSERYNVTTFDNLVLPSADPERQSVQLDLFPSALLESLMVRKNFSADLPGNTTGGAIQVYSSPIPIKRYAKITVGIRATEDQLKGDKFQSYSTSGDADLFALGTQDRLEFPKKGTAPTLLGSTYQTKPQAASVQPGNFPMGKKVLLAFGDRIESTTKADRAWGYNVALAYDSKYENRTEHNQRSSVTNGSMATGSGAAPGKPAPNPFSESTTGSDFYETISSAQVQEGGLVALGYNLNSFNQFKLVGFLSQSGDDKASFRNPSIKPGTPLYTGDLTNNDDYSSIGSRNTLYYRERTLGSLALSGTHTFTDLNGASIDWQLANIYADQIEPDRRDTTVLYNLNYDGNGDYDGTGKYTYGSVRFFRETRERQKVGDLTYSQPITLPNLQQDVIVKSGIGSAVTTRTYRDQALDSFDNTYNVSPTNIYLPDSSPDVYFTTYTKKAFGPPVRGSRDIDYVFSSIQIPVGKLKIVPGVRIERSALESVGGGVNPGSPSDTSFNFYNVARNQQILGVDPAKLLSGGISANIQRTDALPSITSTYKVGDNMNLRAAWSQTLARPSLREIGNYFTSDPDDRTQHGNAFLQYSEINNFDLRWEWFGEKGDLLAVSGFYKIVADPIEKITLRNGLNSIDLDTWINNPSEAKIKGVEFEARKSLAFIDDFFSGTSVGGNITFLSATVERTAKELKDKAPFFAPDSVPTERRLYDQPRWLVNADITQSFKQWGTSITLSAFASDSSLYLIQSTESSTNYDLYNDSFYRIDLSISQKLSKQSSIKFSVGNLADGERRIVYDPKEAYNTSTIYRTWHPGRTYSLSYSLDL
jgi:TonB-dependent receptor